MANNSHNLPPPPASLLRRRQRFNRSIPVENEDLVAPNINLQIIPPEDDIAHLFEHQTARQLFRDPTPPPQNKNFSR